MASPNSKRDARSQKPPVKKVAPKADPKKSIKDEELEDDEDEELEDDEDDEEEDEDDEEDDDEDSEETQDAEEDDDAEGEKIDGLTHKQASVELKRIRKEMRLIKGELRTLRRNATRETKDDKRTKVTNDTALRRTQDALVASLELSRGLQAKDAIRAHLDENDLQSYGKSVRYILADLQLTKDDVDDEGLYDEDALAEAVGEAVNQYVEATPLREDDDEDSPRRKKTSANAKKAPGSNNLENKGKASMGRKALDRKYGGILTGGLFKD